MNAGYSGTPLARKLGIKAGSVIRVVNAPDHYRDLFADWPEDVRVQRDRKTRKDLIHYFTTQLEALHKDITALRAEIKENGAIWISWPKKSSKVPTDVSEDLIRALALRTGLVDVKVCAVDEVWSGLKLVIPVKARK